MKALDPKTFQIQLKAPTGIMLQALGKPSGNAFIMPRKIAETDPFKQIEDYTGSGPFIFVKEEWKPGDKTVYVKNPKYRPRSEPPPAWPAPRSPRSIGSNGWRCPISRR